MGAVEALTVKLSERAFKPIFLRFVEWARAAPPPGALPCISLVWTRSPNGLQHRSGQCASRGSQQVVNFSSTLLQDQTACARLPAVGRWCSLRLQRR